MPDDINQNDANIVIENPIKEETETMSTVTTDIEFEKYKMKMNFFKWVLGTFAIAIMTIIINWGFKDRAVGMNEISQYDKYTTDLLVLNDNPIKKRMLAQFFSTVTPSSKLKCGWKEYYVEVDKDYKKFILKDSLIRIENQKILRKKTIDSADRITLEANTQQINYNDSLKKAPTIIPNTYVRSVTVNNGFKIDVFDLQLYPKESTPKAEKIVALLQKKYPNYNIRLRLLPTGINAKAGYKIDSNQIRYEAGTSEEAIAKSIKTDIESNGVFSREQPFLHPVSNTTPNYISVFVRNN